MITLNSQDKLSVNPLHVSSKPFGYETWRWTGGPLNLPVMHFVRRAHKHKPIVLYMALLDERFWTPLLSGVHNYVFISGSCFVYRHQNYLQECCKYRSSRGTDMVWHPCVGEGGDGDVMPSWQQRGNEDTGGASASDGPCCACENKTKYRLRSQPSLSTSEANFSKAQVLQWVDKDWTSHTVNFI